MAARDNKTRSPGRIRPGDSPSDKCIRRCVFLMYHELELPGRALVQSEPGYVRYIISETGFRSQIDWLRENGWRGLSVSEALQFPAEKSVAITFDDGCETDLIAAATILKEAGFHATFYVTADFLNHPGYMSDAQLRELGSMGFEIGCHSMTHRYLNGLAPNELHHEIVEARMKLQDIINGKVLHFSCPGGRFDDRALDLAKQTGYLSVANSRAHANSPSTDRFHLGRVAILRNRNLTSFGRLCEGGGLLRMRVQDSLRSAVRRTLGNALYDSVRNNLLWRA